MFAPPPKNKKFQEVIFLNFSDNYPQLGSRKAVLEGRRRENETANPDTGIQISNPATSGDYGSREFESRRHQHAVTTSSLESR